jgi:hypothetical protein
MTSAIHMGQRALIIHMLFLRSACENANRDQKKNDGGIREILNSVKIMGVQVVYTIFRRNL